MSGDTLLLIAIGAIALFIVIDYAKLNSHRAADRKTVSFDELAQMNPERYRYSLEILSRLPAESAETLKRYIGAREHPPMNAVEMLDLVYEHIIFQGIADGRDGTVGNPYAAEVVLLEDLYGSLEQLIGPQPECKREKLHAAVSAFETHDGKSHA